MRAWKWANTLADRSQALAGPGYPVGIQGKLRIFTRPISWPVWSSVAATRKQTIYLVLLLVAAGCRRPPAAAVSAQPQRGGELVASLRSEPGNYNRYFDASAAADLMAILTQARLVRINRVTDEIEPALAERWESADDARTHTLHLRQGVTFSDGAPFTAADVLFSFSVAYDAPGSRLGDSITAAGQRFDVSSPDPAIVIIRSPVPFAPGIRILDNLPILPRHKLDAAMKNGTIQNAWVPSTPLGEIVGLGPFILSEHVAGQRLVFTRNPHYWRRAADGGALPYLDRLRVEIIPDQNAEALRLESGATDLMSNADIRPDDYARFTRLADQGRLKLLDAGVGLDPNALWFNLKPPAGADRKPWLRRAEFRQAISLAVDRDAIANTVYRGAAVPVSSPVTPRFGPWYSTAVPTDPHDPARARRLLAAAGLTDKDGDGQLEDPSGAPVRFSVLVQKDLTMRERTVSLLQEQLRRVGIALDVVGLDVGSIGKRWMAGDYDSIFHGFQVSATDPAMTLDFWLSSGSSHFWNPGQPKPATSWEAKIDDLMRRQATSTDMGERQRLFVEVQRVFAEQMPALYFVAPKVTIALSPRVLNATPAPQVPQLLWSADTLAASAR
jgi:peptide/nickel transport system substrate-binding protein